MSEYLTSQPQLFHPDGTPYVYSPLAASFQKSQYLLGFTIDALFLRVAPSHVLFVTLTFPKPIHSVRQAHRHLSSFFNKLRPRHRDYVWVLEPQYTGRIHFHLLIPVGFDAHVGTDLEAWKDRGLHDDNVRYLHASMNPLLRAEAKWWETTARRYGFGRVEVAPIHSTVEGVRKYLCKQDWRSGHWPFKERKSFRFWGRSSGLSAGTIKFAWNSPGAQTCRRRLRDWAHQMGCETLDDLPEQLGKNWGYHFHLHLRQLRAGGSRHRQEGSEAEDPLMTQGRASGRAGIPVENETQAESGILARWVSGREAELGRAASHVAPAPAPPEATLVPLSCQRPVSPPGNPLPLPGPRLEKNS